MTFSWNFFWQVGGMLPPKEGDSLLVQSPVYAQIFISHNGQCADQCNTKITIETYAL